MREVGSRPSDLRCLSPFRLGEEPNIGTGVAMITLAPGRKPPHRRSGERRNTLRYSPNVLYGLNNRGSSVNGVVASIRTAATFAAR